MRSFSEASAEEFRQEVRGWLRRAIPQDWRRDRDKMDETGWKILVAAGTHSVRGGVCRAYLA